MKAQIAVFGPNGPVLFETIRTVIRGLEHTPVRYKYISVEEHLEILKSNLAEGVRIQVTELLYHAHFAAVATLVRAHRWAEGCLAAYSQGIFLPFCASARGLLEAAGDSYAALPRVPLSLAENHVNIKRALSGSSPPTHLMNYGEIEDVLLHFSHAKRVDKAHKNEVPDYMRAKFATTYIKPLEVYPPGGFCAWYQELCELSHPASDSICYMLLQQEDGSLTFHPSLDREHIHEHITKHQQRLTEALRISQIPALVMLRVLSHIGPSELHIRTLNDVDISHVQLWKKCAASLNIIP